MKRKQLTPQEKAIARCKNVIARCKRLEARYWKLTDAERQNMDPWLRKFMGDDPRR